MPANSRWDLIRGLKGYVNFTAVCLQEAALCIALCNTTTVPELRYYETRSEIESVFTV